MRIRALLARFGLPLLGLVLAVAAVAAYFGSRAGRAGELADQALKIQDLERRIQTAEAAAADMAGEAMEQVTALDAARVASDRDRVETFFESIMTWDSYAAYKQVREDTMSEYGLGPDSGFMKLFLPEIPELIGEDGTSYNIIDTVHIDGTPGYNMTFESADTYVLGMSGGSYLYLAFVTWSTVGGSGYEGMHTEVVRLSVDGGGTISDLQGYLGIVSTTHRL